jgi:hypothetical protein
MFRWARRLVANRYNDWRQENVFGINTDAAKAALRDYVNNRPLCGDDQQKLLVLIDKLVQALAKAFGV